MSAIDPLDADSGRTDETARVIRERGGDPMVCAWSGKETGSAFTEGPQAAWQAAGMSSSSWMSGSDTDVGASTRSWATDLLPLLGAPGRYRRMAAVTGKDRPRNGL